MLNRISHWLHSISSGWIALATTAIFIVFTLLVLPAQTTRIESDSGNLRVPDLSLFYTPKDLYSIAQALGEEGRREYIKDRFTFDVVWPAVYTAFLATTLSWVSARSFEQTSKWRRINLLPLWGSLFDYLENLATSTVMFRYPDQTPGIDLLASFATPLKWLCIGAGFGILAMGISILAWHKLRQKLKR